MTSPTDDSKRRRVASALRTLADHPEVLRELAAHLEREDAAAQRRTRGKRELLKPDAQGHEDAARALRRAGVTPR